MNNTRQVLLYAYNLASGGVNSVANSVSGATPPPRAIDGKEQKDAAGENLVRVLASLGVEGNAQSLIDRMRAGKDGIDIKRRWKFLSIYATCFTGSDFVAWCIRNKVVPDAAKAIELGSAFLQFGAMRCLTADNKLPLQDGDALYRFQADEMSPILNTRSLFEGQARSALVVASELQKSILKMYGKFLSEDGRHVDYKGLAASPEYAEYVVSTSELQRIDLRELFDNDTEKMVFFINLYNACVVHANIELGPATAFSRSYWFKTTGYHVGGFDFTLDDMEHGVLRGNRLHGGVIPFPPQDPRAPLAVKQVDPRIHFALVCGAKSCPPIRLFKPENLDRGLTLAAENFFASELQVEVESRTIKTTKLLDWYENDFGATREERLRWVAQFLDEAKKKSVLGLVESGDFTLKFNPYDWSLNGA